MSWNAPRYAKKAAAKLQIIPPPDPAEIIGIVVAGTLVPVYEPLMAEDTLVLSDDGDLLIAQSASVPLEVI